jgi:hypothetical protein
MILFLGLFMGSSPYLLWFLLGISFYFFFKTPSPIKAIIISVVLILVARIPVILTNQSLNADEAQFLAQAITILDNPIVYKSFDPVTAGPLSSYLLALPCFFGITPSYVLAHTMAVLLQIVFFISLFNLCTRFWGVKIAKIATLPVLTLFVFTNQPHFLHYSSELLAIILLNYLAACFLQQLNNQPLSRWRWFWQGLVCVVIVFCKLQAIPVAVIIVVFSVLHFFLRERFSVMVFKNIVLLAAGVVVAVAIFWAIAWYWNIADQVFLYYFKGNFIHSNPDGLQPTLFDSISAYVIAATNDLVEFKIMLACVLALICLSVFYKNTNKHKPLLVAFVVVVFGVVAFVIAKSGYVFYHYLNFTFLPFTLLFALMLSHLQTWPAWVFLMVLGIIFVVYCVNNKFKNNYPYRGTTLEKSAISKYILKYAKAGQKLAVWGWMPQYYVETQMPQGTCDNHTIRVFQFRLESEHLQRYISDMKRNKPVVFVDAVAESGFWMTNRAYTGFQKLPELSQLIANQYICVDSVQGQYIYIRKDRLAKP